MGTLIQSYGPIYGEVVNGTVQGRPNGSVFVPITNTIGASLVEAYRYLVKTADTTCAICDSTGTLPSATRNRILINAVAQDLASNLVVAVYEDADCTTLVARISMNAGVFNANARSFFFVADEYTIVAESTYYIRAELMNNNTAIAISETIALTGVVR